MLKQIDCLISEWGGKETIKLTHKSFIYDEWAFFPVIIILSVTQ